MPRLVYRIGGASSMETSGETRMLTAMLLGAHESVAGGPHTAIARGKADGCEAVQIFARPSAQWRAKPLLPEELSLFRSEHATVGLPTLSHASDRKADGCEAVQIFARPSAQWRAKPLLPEEISLFRSEHATVGWPTLSHASYLINLSAADPDILAKSRDALADEMFRAEELGLDFVVLHPGAHLGAGVADGVEAAADSLSDLDARTRGMRVQLLLEITAGQGSCLGCRFEEMEAMLARARGGESVGICFDTCHAHASGYDLSTEEGYERTFEAFARVIGLDRLRAFHLNDSKTPTGSHVDRHAEIGDGYLGLLPFWRLVNDARFAM